MKNSHSSSFEAFFFGLLRKYFPCIVYDDISTKLLMGKGYYHINHVSINERGEYVLGMEYFPGTLLPTRFSIFFSREPEIKGRPLRELDSFSIEEDASGNLVFGYHLQSAPAKFSSARGKNFVNV